MAQAPKQYGQQKLVKVASEPGTVAITKPTVKNIVGTGTREEIEVQNLPDKPERFKVAQKLTGAELLAQIKSKNTTPVLNSIEDVIGQRQADSDEFDDTEETEAVTWKIKDGESPAKKEQQKAERQQWQVKRDEVVAAS